MKILAIESSCDETAAAVVADEGVILSNVVVSQVDIFAAYGGVIPEVAARSHLEAILPVVRKALDDAGVTKDEIDYIAVTHTPGLMGSLMIGTLTARMLAVLWKKPLYAVHHLKSHIYANWLKTQSPLVFPTSSSSVVEFSSSKESENSSQEVKLQELSEVGNANGDYDTLANSHKSNSSKDLSEDCNPPTDTLQPISKHIPEFPLLALVVSGGHTQIIYMEAHNKFEIIGTTRDDAVGECFDKVAKILGLPYPGGPSIARCAAMGMLAYSSNPVALSSSKDSDPRQPQNDSRNMQTVSRVVYKLPHPKVEGLDFSFSGLKTAVLRAVQAELGLPITTPSYELAEKLTEQQRADFAASFQETAAEILVEKLEMALVEHPEVRSVVLAGGVSANEVLREKALGLATEKRKVYFPELKFAGDNAAMVGAAAYYEIISGVKPTDPYKLSIAPRTDIH